MNAFDLVYPGYYAGELNAACGEYSPHHRWLMTSYLQAHRAKGTSKDPLEGYAAATVYYLCLVHAPHEAGAAYVDVPWQMYDAACQQVAINHLAPQITPYAYSFPRVRKQIADFVMVIRDWLASSGAIVPDQFSDNFILYTAAAKLSFELLYLVDAWNRAGSIDQIEEISPYFWPFKFDRLSMTKHGRWQDGEQYERFSKLHPNYFGNSRSRSYGASYGSDIDFSDTYNILEAKEEEINHEIDDLHEEMSKRRGQRCMHYDEIVEELARKKRELREIEDAKDSLY